MSKKEQAFVLFDQGKRPGDQEVKKLGLKPKTTYNYYQVWKKSGGITEAEEKEGKQVKGQSLPTTNDINNAQVIRFQPHVITCPFTPIMSIARQVAIKEWDWPSDIRFEDFIDTILYQFFKDRGITLQGYIVEEEQGDSD
jgi:hypothetical protein